MLIVRLKLLIFCFTQKVSGCRSALRLATYTPTHEPDHWYLTQPDLTISPESSPCYLYLIAANVNVKGTFGTTMNKSNVSHLKLLISGNSIIRSFNRSMKENVLAVLLTYFIIFWKKFTMKGRNIEAKTWG